MPTVKYIHNHKQLMTLAYPVLCSSHEPSFSLYKAAKSGGLIGPACKNSNRAHRPSLTKVFASFLKEQMQPILFVQKLVRLREASKVVL